MLSHVLNSEMFFLQSSCPWFFSRQPILTYLHKHLKVTVSHSQQVEPIPRDRLRGHDQMGMCHQGEPTSGLL